jgi:glycosyltransferase involved in cell wall biosynthesis
LPTIAAVVGVYNGEDLIGETVRSILDQTRPADELIVVDDGSTDGTAEILAGFGDAIRVIRQTNGGCPAAFNRAFSEARSEFVAMCGADDLWEPTKLERQAAALARFPEIDVAFGGSWSFGSVELPWPDPPGVGILDGDELYRVLFDENIICASSIVVRRRLYNDLGPFIEQVNGERFACDDYDYWLRALESKAVFYYEPGIHTYYRRHAGNATHNQVWVCKSRTATHAIHAPHVEDRQLLARTMGSDLRLQARAELAVGSVAAARRSFMRSLRYERNIRAVAFVLILLLPPTWVRALVERWERIRPSAHRLRARTRKWLALGRPSDLKQTFVGLALTAQRRSSLSRLLPRPLRRMLRRVAGKGIESINSHATPVDDWSRPLVEGRQMVDLPVNAQPPVLQPSHDGSRAGNGVSESTETGGRCRCLLVTASLDAGGMDEVVAFLAQRLPASGVDVAVMHAVGDTPSELGRAGNALRAKGIEVVSMHETAGRRWLREWHPDVISAHGAPGWVLEEAASIEIPYVDVLHGMHSLFGVDWSAEEQRSGDVAAVVAVSELVRSQYLAGVPSYPADRVVTIPNGVDTDRQRTIDRAVARAALGLENEFLFVSLARHCLQKNSFALVSAFDDVASMHRDAHLLVAGRVDDPLYATQVRQLRDRLPDANRIHLRDHAPDPALILSAADAFVLDSFFEGWALASMEALYAGLPTIVSDVGGAREQVGPQGKRGYLVPNPLGDPLIVNWETMRAACYRPQDNRQELVDAMSKVVSERDRWAEQRGELAAESADRFNPDLCVSRHAELLTAVAASAGVLT